MMLTELPRRTFSSSLPRLALQMILLLPILQLQAQESPSVNGPDDASKTSIRFEPAGKYSLEIDGQTLGDARAYLSFAAGSAVLVDAQELTSPLLLRPGAKRVERVRRDALHHQASGALLLADDDAPETIGTYQVEGASLVWSDADRRMRLKERPMLGLHDASAVANWDPQYSRRASRYSPSQATVDALRQKAGNARVRVYFGTWCPRCGHAVPKLMRLTSELEGSGLKFEYFGMPKLEEDATESFWHEAKEAGAFQDEVNIVPLVVVYRDARRIGRITGGWGNPERELEKILLGESVH